MHPKIFIAELNWAVSYAKHSVGKIRTCGFSYRHDFNNQNKFFLFD